MLLRYLKSSCNELLGNTKRSRGKELGTRGLIGMASGLMMPGSGLMQEKRLILLDTLVMRRERVAVEGMLVAATLERQMIVHAVQVNTGGYGC